MVEMSVVDLRETHKRFEMQVLCHNIFLFPKAEISNLFTSYMRQRTTVFYKSGPLNC